jgi:hypothetical protein
MEALELLDLISVPSVVSVPQVLVIEDSFFQSTRDLQANDAPYISAKRELDSIQAEMVVRLLWGLWFWSECSGLEASEH